jgi:pimeloyl-ACP methyl ester carboxylesterase
VTPPTSPPLAALRTFRDERLRVVERFLTPRVGGRSTVAVLSMPLGRPAGLGWVMCHGFGREQAYLQSLEVAGARALARVGFPVLRFHAQGYGDSEASTDTATPTSHIRDACDAVKVLRARAGVERVGLLGARFGGAVAALTADRVDASALVLWDPVAEGSTYLDELLRRAAAGELAAAGRPRDSASDPITVLRDEGVLDALGYPLRREVADAIAAIHLPTDLRRFDGTSLILQVSRSPGVRPDLQALRDRLDELGARTLLDVVVDRQARAFGEQRHRRTGEGRMIDSQHRMSQRLLQATVTFAREMTAGPLPTVGSHSPPVSPPIGNSEADDRPVSDREWSEHPIFVPHRSDHVAAVISLPASTPRGLVLLIQGGVAPRSHRNRLWTRIARDLAQRGVASVRMECMGHRRQHRRIPIRFVGSADR